ncbi:acyltransferase family protein [Cohnella lubricantis]|uniref:Acyltransferase family protein n=1 Tax=Cohnella lubricantis TaxID=2163172 RepID=A0A841T9X5_9BACL|nr:acyltransferase family protein [Cohnella lubricantis]MBB6676846.1 acyltransferase family protein [Cohnella lubricantis]MBP2119426.1 fucose 4-O-acetylase-like acetyltransferase [Cohnella lubricantis]
MFVLDGKSPIDSGKRLEWADIAKGIAIILVLVAHTPLEYDPIGIFINSFHMALFFAISGFFYRTDAHPSFAAFLAKKARTLLIPYVSFATVSFLYFLLRYHFGDSAYYADLSVMRQFFGIFYSAGIREWMDFNLPLWFLTCLFSVEVIYYWIARLAGSRVLILYTLLTCSLLGYLDSVVNPYKLPWSLDVAMTAVVFFGLGHLFKSLIDYLVSLPLAAKIIGGLLFLGLNIAFTVQRVNLNMKLLGHYIDFYMAAICGIVLCLLLSSAIRSKALAYLGRNALIIMAGHLPLFTIVSRLLVKFGPITNTYAYEFTKVFVTLLLLLPIIYVINHYFPFILGRSFRLKIESKISKGMLS